MEYLPMASTVSYTSGGTSNPAHTGLPRSFPRLRTTSVMSAKVMSGMDSTSTADLCLPSFCRIWKASP